jgi:hypothetical protein
MSIIDTRFIPEVRPPTNDAYVCVEELTKAGSLSILILSEWSPRSSLVSTIKSPRRRGQDKLSEVHHNLDDSHTTPSPSRGQVPKSNEYTEIVDEVLESKIERITQEWSTNLS